MWSRRALPSLNNSLDEFIDVTLSEFDFIKEAKRTQLIRDNINIEGVYFPKIYHELSSKNVLAMEYIEGESLMKYINRGSYQDNKNIIKKIFEITFHQIFILGLFSSDPHPGNFLVHNKNDKLIITPLDFGQVGYIEKSEINKLALLMKAMSTNDDNLLYESLKAIGYKSRKNNKIFQVSYMKSMMDTKIRTDIDYLADFEKLNEIDDWTDVPKSFNLISKTITTLSGICTLCGIYDLSFADEISVHLSKIKLPN